MATVRLQKILARAGVASRRAAEAMITAGRVRVDGRIVTTLGAKVDPRDSRVEVDGQRIVREASVYVILHKPRGVVSTMSDPEGRPTVRQLLADVPGRVHPVGRLDFNTSGVLVATNDGDFTDALLHPRREVPKTYVVKVQGTMQARDVDRWRTGVELEDGTTAPAKVKLLRHEADKTWLEVTITEGRNLQVRRMGDATGFRVMRLARQSFAGVTAEGLPPGRWRHLTTDELRDLKKEYGVPKRVVAPPRPVPAPPPAPRPRPSPLRRSHRPTESRGRGPQQDSSGSPNPRYGGGSPARRDVGARDDWGGGVRRGSSASRQGGGEEPPPRADVGGRGGRTRTTGTGGGVGAGEGTYRMEGTRRRGGSRDR